MRAAGLFILLQAAAWAALWGDPRIANPNPDWIWGGNLLGSAALLWLMLTLLFLYPRHATAIGAKRAARLWMAAAPVVMLAVVEWLHTGPAMFASTGTAIAVVIFAAMMGTIFALWGCSRPAQIAVGVLWWLLALVSNIKTAFRGTPMVPWDIYALSTAMEVVGGYTPRVTREMIGSFVVLALYCAVCWRHPARVRGWAKRCAALALSLGVLGGMGAALLLPGFPLYLDIPTNNWVLSTIYKREGFATGLIVNCRQLLIDRPEAYDPQELRETLAHAQAPAFPVAMEEPPVNIVVIMNESFADLQALVPFETTRPMYENLRALSEACVHGRLHVSVHGGGTSTSEFEMLTGHSAAFLPAECAPFVQYLHPSRRNGYSLAWLLKGQGYDTVAVHPAEPGNWKRDIAYPLLGFNRFLSLGDMTGKEEPANSLRGMYTDEALYGELLRLLRLKPPGQRLFVHCVTMQNHGGYLQAESDEIGPRVDLIDHPAGAVKTKKADQTEADRQEAIREIGNYLTLAEQSDRALGEFVRALEAVEEPTLLLFFGDHQPTVSRLLTEWAEGLDRWDAEPEERAELFVTPLLIWSNRGLPAMDIGDISVQYLGVLLTQAAGLPLDGYQRFLAELREQWPVFTVQAARDGAGAFHTFEEALNQSPGLQTHQAAQYNLLLDDRWKVYRYPE